MTSADHLVDMNVGNSTGWAPVTEDRISALAAATGIAVGDGAVDGEMDTDGDVAAEGLGDDDALGLVGPQAATRPAAPMANTAAMFDFMHLLSSVVDNAARGRWPA